MIILIPIVLFIICVRLAVGLMDGHNKAHGYGRYRRR